MLSLIGLLALIYLVFKFLPDLLMFMAKAVIFLIALILFLKVVAFILPFGIFISI